MRSFRIWFTAALVLVTGAEALEAQTLDRESLLRRQQIQQRVREMARQQIELQQRLEEKTVNIEHLRRQAEGPRGDGKTNPPLPKRQGLSFSRLTKKLADTP